MLPAPQYRPYTRHHVHFSLFGFLRCAELTASSKFDPAINPTISDLTILDSETISFLIKQSKTDQVKKGHFVYIFNLSSPIQPYQAVRDRQTSFSILRLARPTQPRCRLTAMPSNPLNFALLSKPSDSARALPVRQSYLFKSTLDEAYPSDTAVPKPQSDVGESLPARQSYLSSLTLGEAYPSDTAIVEATIRRRQDKLILSVCSHHDIEPRQTLRARPFRQS